MLFSPVPFPSVVLLLALALMAGVYDFRFRRIPNWLTVSGVLSGFLVHFSCSGWAGLGAAATGMGLAFAIYLPLYLLKGMGAGDVKLMAAVGALAGAANWFLIFLATALIGGVLAVCLSILRGRLYQVLCNVEFMVFDLAHFRVPYRTNSMLDVRTTEALRMPHGVSIAMGTCVVLAWTRGAW